MIKFRPIETENKESYGLVPASSKQASLFNILNKPMLITGKSEAPKLSKIESLGITVCEIRHVSKEHIELAHDSNSIKLVTPPTNCILLTTSDPKNFSLLEELKGWMVLRGANPSPRTFFDDFSTNDEMSHTLIQSLVALLDGTSERAVRLARSLARIRAAHDGLQDRFSELEAYIIRKNGQPYEKTFADEPVSDAKPISILDPPYLISQLLPVSSSGVAAIALHFAEVGHPHHLQIRMRSEEDNQVIETWDLTDIGSQGWVHMQLEHAIIQSGRTISIEISNMVGETQTKVSLGRRQYVNRFQARDANTGASVSEHSLAMMIWAGLPGVRTPDVGSVVEPLGKSRLKSGPSQTCLRPEVCDAVQLVSFHGGPQPGFNPVTALADQGYILCHPPPFGLTIARIPNALRPNAMSVRATVKVDNAQSGAILFAIAVSNDSREIAKLTSGDASDWNWSGWKRLDASEFDYIEVQIKTLQAGSDIYLITKMEVEGSNAFAWAKFGQIEVLSDEAG